LARRPPGGDDARMLVLYDNATSTNALKVRFLLRELGLDAERVDVPLGEVRPDWYREIHPFATVPCLVDDGLVLTESNTILRYLAAREGRDDLYPTELRARARADALLDALSLQVRPALWAAELAVIYGTPPPGDWRAPLAAAIGGFERLIDDGGYATGAFSIVDCAARARLAHLPELGLDLAAYPRTRRLYEVVGARPAYRAESGGVESP
jgi:glutathione S-transferase